MKRAIIIGATSGIGKEVAKGWKIGVAGRRKTALDAFRTIAPDNIEVETLDVTQEDATERLHSLIKKLGGMDLFLLSSGVGHQNMELNADIELNTARTNVDGFIRMVTAAFQYFRQQGNGHLVLQEKRRRTSGRYQFHCRYQGLGCCSGIFGYQTVSEHLYRCPRTTIEHAKVKHPLHGYPPGICINRTIE